MTNECVTFGLFSYKLFYLGCKTAKNAGFRGFDLNLRAYCAERISQRCDKGGLFTSRRRLSFGDVLNAPRARIIP